MCINDAGDSRRYFSMGNGCSRPPLNATTDYKNLLQINTWFRKKFPKEWQIVDEDLQILSSNINVIPYFLETFAKVRDVILLSSERGSSPEIVALFDAASSIDFVGHPEPLWELKLKKLRDNFAIIGSVVRDGFTDIDVDIELIEFYHRIRRLERQWTPTNVNMLS